MAVRNESVRLSLEDAGFTTGMAKAAAATALLDAKLNDLDGSNVGASSGLKNSTRDVDNLGNAFQRNEAKIDKFSGRLRLAADAVAMLGPGLVPIAALGVPALAGMATQFGLVALGAGATILAFQGVGDALSAVNKAQLDPTTANLKAARLAMDRLAPSAQAFVQQLQEMRPAFAAVRDAGADELFPRLSVAFAELETSLPKVEQLMATFGRTIGEIGIMTADSLADGEWNHFIDYINREAEPTLTSLASTVGHVAHGMGELVIAMDPLSDGFTGWLNDVAKGFDDWAEGLSKTDNFAEFVQYIQDTGPQVADTFGAMANAVLQIAEAAAPLGGPVLAALEGIADVIAKVANSKLGTPLLIALSTFSALNTASALWGRVLEASSARGATGIGRVTNALGKAIAATVALEAAGRAMQALEEAAAGAAPNVEELTSSLIEADASGFAETFGGDLSEALDALDPSAVEGFAGALNDLGEKGGGIGTALTRGLGSIVGIGDEMAAAGAQAEGLDQAFASLDAALAGLVASGGAERAQAAFAELASSQGLTAGQTKDLLALLPGYSDALAATGNSATLAAEDAAAAGPKIGELGAFFGTAADQIDQFIHSFESLQGLLDLSASIGNYEAALDGLTASLKENGNAWNQSTEKGRANMERAREVVSSTIERVDALRKAGKDAAAQKFMTRAIADLQSFAAQSPAAAKALGPLIRELKRVNDTHAKPTVEVKGLGSAIGSLGSMLGQLQNIDGFTANAFVHIQRSGSTIGIGGVADGGTIPGLRQPYGDKHLFMLAPGEEVISNRRGQADRFRPLLKQINNAADGTTVGNTYAATTGGRPLEAMGFNALFHELEAFTVGLHHLSDKELDIRKRDMARIETLLDKRVDLAKKEADADKSRLDAMLDMQKQFEDQVAGLFKSDVFGKSGDSKMYAVSPDGSRVEVDLDSLTAEQAAVFQASGATFQSDSGTGDAATVLGGDIARIRESLRLYKELRDRGFDGPAFRELVGAADVETLTAYAAMSRAELRNIENLFNTRDRLAQQAGQFVGQAEFGSDIHGLRQDYRESLASAKRLETKVENLTSEVKALKQQESKAPQLIGQAVGGALTGAVRDGQTGRGRRG